MHQAEVVLGRRDALVGSRMVPAGCLDLVLSNLAAAVLVELAEIELGDRVAGLGQALPNIPGAPVVALTIGGNAIGDGLGRGRHRRQAQGEQDEA